MSASHLKKLEHNHVCQRVTSPLLLTTVYKHLETEETCCWTFGRGMSSHSCLKYKSSCSTVSGLSLSYFAYFDALNIYIWWKVWTAGRSVEHLDSSTTETCCCIRWSIRFENILLKYVDAIKLTMSLYFSCPVFNIWNVFYVLLCTICWFMRFTNHCIFILLSIQTFEEL